MIPAANVDEVLRGVEQARKGASAFCTNFFPVQSRLQSWIEHGELFLQSRAGVSFCYRKDRDFWHLYYSAESPQALARELGSLEIARDERVTIDVIAASPALEAAAAPVANAGFIPYSKLLRLARPAAKEAEKRSDIVNAAQALTANPADAEAVLRLLEQSFDARAEQVPLGYEVADAIRAGQIYCIRVDGAIAAVLFFETQGLTSTLRFWSVGSEFKGRGYGSALIRHYFSDQPSVRRFVLWVAERNGDAVAKYLHYGYCPDGLADQILVNRKIAA